MYLTRLLQNPAHLPTAFHLYEDYCVGDMSKQYLYGERWSSVLLVDGKSNNAVKAPATAVAWREHDEGSSNCPTFKAYSNLREAATRQQPGSVSCLRWKHTFKEWPRVRLVGPGDGSLHMRYMEVCLSFRLVHLLGISRRMASEKALHAPIYTKYLPLTGKVLGNPYAFLLLPP